MSRTTADAVKDVLKRDYSAREAFDLGGVIDTAAVIVDQVNSCASDSGLTLTAANLEVIERWLAAHLYAVSDRPYAASTAGRSSSTYDGKTGMRLDATLYGQTALLADPSGCLAALAAGRGLATLTWMGKRPGEQLDVDERY